MKISPEAREERIALRKALIPDEVLIPYRLENESQEEYNQRRKDYKEGMRILYGKPVLKEEKGKIPYPGQNRQLPFEFKLAIAKNNRMNTKGRKKYACIRHLREKKLSEE